MSLQAMAIRPKSVGAEAPPTKAVPTTAVLFITAMTARTATASTAAVASKAPGGINPASKAEVRWSRPIRCAPRPSHNARLRSP
ncbi:hypothetical protein [Lysobacter enzymogenes]|uniref:hypothetical protein n=1 Tax=Lysobacter enzymogenes TaxID=69 RepID=UPI003CCCDE9C